MPIARLEGSSDGGRIARITVEEDGDTAIWDDPRFYGRLMDRGEVGNRADGR